MKLKKKNLLKIFWHHIPIFRPNTSLSPPRIDLKLKLIYIRIPLIISSLLIYNRTFWLLIYLVNFPKFLTFSDFPTFSHISTSSSSHIENRFIWAWSPVSGEYEYEKNFFKIFYSTNFTWSDMYIQFSTCHNFSG